MDNPLLISSKKHCTSCTLAHFHMLVPGSFTGHFLFLKACSTSTCLESTSKANRFLISAEKNFHIIALEWPRFIAQLLLQPFCTLRASSDCRQSLTNLDH